MPPRRRNGEDPLRIHFEVQYVGRMIKHAKRQVTWKFAFEGDTDEHAVVLRHTLNSGKKVVFLNGNQIFEEEKLSMSQWQHTFQLDGHMLCIIIENQISEEGMYILRIDGRDFEELPITTIADLRATSRKDKSDLTPWTRGGAMAGTPVAAPTRGAVRRGGNGSAADEDDDIPVPSKSLRDFVGAEAFDAAVNGTSAAGGNGGGAWDPFGGSGDAAPAPAFTPSVTPARASVASRITSPPTTGTMGTTNNLRAPPTATAPGRAAVPSLPQSSASADAFDFGATPVSATTTATSYTPSGGARRPSMPSNTAAAAPVSAAKNVNSLADDLAGLSFFGGAGAVPAAPAANNNNSFSDPFADPFGTSSSTTTTTTAAAPVVDIFSQPLPSSGNNNINFGASMTAAPTAAAVGGDDMTHLYNLDNLKDAAGAKRGANAAAATGNRPSLAQLAAQQGGPAAKPKAATGPVMMGGGAMSSGLGMSPLDLYTAPVPPVYQQGGGMGMGMQMGAMGMQQQRPMGGMGMGQMGGMQQQQQPGMAGMYQQQQMGQMGMGMGGGFGMQQQQQQSQQQNNHGAFDFGNPFA